MMLNSILSQHGSNQLAQSDMYTRRGGGACATPHMPIPRAKICRDKRKEEEGNEEEEEEEEERQMNTMALSDSFLLREGVSVFAMAAWAAD